MDIEKLLKVTDCAEILSVPESRIRQLVFRKQIPFLKCGRLVRFTKRDIEKYIESIAVNPVNR